MVSLFGLFYAGFPQRSVLSPCLFVCQCRYEAKHTIKFLNDSIILSMVQFIDWCDCRKKPPPVLSAVIYDQPVGAVQ